VADSRQKTAENRQETAVPALMALFPASFRAAGEGKNRREGEVGRAKQQRGQQRMVW
jgi:hypothetical protein